MQSSVRVMFAGFFALTLLALSAAAAPEAGEVYRFDNSTTQAGLALTRQSATGVELQFGLESFRMNPVTVSGETMQTITMPGVMLPNDAGAPNLPGLGRFIALPEGATARLEIAAVCRFQIHERLRPGNHEESFPTGDPCEIEPVGCRRDGNGFPCRDRIPQRAHGQAGSQLHQCVQSIQLIDRNMGRHGRY